MSAFMTFSTVIVFLSKIFVHIESDYGVRKE